MSPSTLNTNVASTLLFGSIAGMCEHLAVLPFRNQIDVKQFLSASQLDPKRTFTHGIAPTILGSGLAHIGLYACFHQSIRETDPSRILAWGALGSLSHLCFHIPGDTIRMRANILQCDTKTAIRHIYQTAGVRGFFAGIVPSLLMGLPAGIVEFLVINSIFQRFGQDGITPFVAGGIAGICSSLLVSPLDTIKTFIQLQGVPSQYVGQHTFRQLIKYIYVTRSLRGFFRGMWLRAISSAIGYGTFGALANAFGIPDAE